MASVVGLYNGEDVSLGDTIFNKISDDQCAWIVTDLEGWWGLPDVDVADDPKTQALDGSYFTFGRYLPRTVALRGQILPLDGVANKAVAARSTLNRALAPLARSRVLLSVEEDDPKVSLVQLAGAPLTRIDKTTGQLTFDILLRAVDPVKYSADLHESATTLAATSPGRTYNRTFYYSYGGKTTSGIISATNIGSYRSDAIFTITGPVTRPRIEHVEQGVFLEFNVVLGTNETLTINTRTKKILFGGASRRNTLTPDSRWFTLTPGLNTIRYSGTQQIPAQPELPAGTNLNTNPSAETTSGTVEVRRNRVVNPRGTNPGVLTDFVLAPQWYGDTPNAGTTTYITGASDGPEVSTGVTVPTYGRKTWTAVGGSAGALGWQLYNGPRGAVTAGTTITASMFWRRSTNVALTTNDVRVEFYTAATGGTKVGATLSSPTFTAPGAATWQRVSGTFEVPVGATHAAVYHLVSFSPASVTVGMTLDATAALVEVSPILSSYFDGVLTNDSDLVSSWVGTANSSQSILTGVGVTGASGGANRFVVSSTQWKSTGLRSLRIISNGITSDAYPASIRTFTSGDIGKTYTVLAKCRLSGATTGNSHSSSRSIFLSGQADKSSQALNNAGETILRLTFTVSAAGDLRLGGGGIQGGGDIWWDDILVVEGNYTGDYFDGNFPFASWTGATNASTSVRPFVPEVPETMLQLSYRDAWID